jgi:phosphatidylglycerophosphate synthase
MYVVARIFVIPIAKRIATKLQTTNVSPNTITTLSALSGIIAGLMLLSDQLIYRVLSALMIHASITLDFADGYLARLKGIESKFGYWFDTLMDEAVKISLFAAIAANFVLHDKLLWGFLAIATLALYHILSINHWLSSALSGQDTTASAKSTTVRTPGIFGAAKRWLTRLSYLDVHLYLIAATAITNTLEIAIILFLGLYSASFFRLIQTRFSTQAIN